MLTLKPLRELVFVELEEFRIPGAIDDKGEQEPSTTPVGNDGMPVLANVIAAGPDSKLKAGDTVLCYPYVANRAGVPMFGDGKCMISMYDIMAKVVIEKS